MQVHFSPPLLVLESGGTIASASVITSDRRILSKSAVAGQSHSSELLPMSHALLEEADLTVEDLNGIVVGIGPGSFTGLRVACGIAQGLSLGLSLPILPVNGFFAWSYAWWLGMAQEQSALVDVAFDARLGEQFAAQVSIDLAGAELRIRWSQPPSVRPVMDDGAVRGMSPEVSHVLIDPDREQQISRNEPFAVWLARWAIDERLASCHEWVSAEQLAPLYVRDKVAQTIAERATAPDLSWVPMTSRDLASVMVIENQAYPFPWSSGNFKDSLAAGYSMWVLREHQVMLGYMVWMQVVDEAHLLNITLTPARQGHGLGRWMMRSLIEQVKAVGLERIVLEVRPSNTRAIRLYERSGFHRIGLRKGYYPSAPETAAREDAIVMALDLREAPSRGEEQHV
ncbi:MAG: hypothetical protein RJA58_446 [Pseudomonadota bacterium]